MRKKAITVGMLVCVVALVVGGLAIAQPQGARQGRRQGAAPGGGPGGGPGGFDPARMREMMSQRLQQQLGASDDEWKVMGPRVMKVMELNRDASGGGMGRMFMRGRPGQRGGQGDRQRPGQGDRQRPERPQGREQSAVESAADQLQTTLENESASPDDIKKQLTTLRGAREKAKQELAKAQLELRQICTLRQEAELVLMGMLN
ncbi:MAG: hypothetical protein JW741_03025 [Sedimentisphaerales bacterium]|nr:hypothetical protein [Sedimentisphaerales bacterium]